MKSSGKHAGHDWVGVPEKTPMLGPTRRGTGESSY